MVNALITAKNIIIFLHITKYSYPRQNLILGHMWLQYVTLTTGVVVPSLHISVQEDIRIPVKTSSLATRGSNVWH